MNNTYLTKVTSVSAIEFQETWGHDISKILKFIGESIENIQSKILIDIDLKPELSKIIISYNNKTVTLSKGQWLVFDGDSFCVLSPFEFQSKFEKAA